MMHGHEKSDSAIVAVKPTNKAEHSAAEQSTAELFAAEPVEPRAETKRNAGQQSTCGTQGQISVSQALERIRRAQQDEHSRMVICRSSQAPPPPCAPPASDRTDTARLADRDLQTLRAAQLPLCRRNWAWPQAISFPHQSNRRAPARRLRAECGSRRR